MRHCALKAISELYLNTEDKPKMQQEIFRTIVAVYLKVTRERSLLKLTDVCGYIEKFFMQVILYDKDPEKRAQQLLTLWRASKDNQVMIKLIISHGFNVRRIFSEIAEAGLHDEIRNDKDALRNKMDKLAPFMKFQEKKEMNVEIFEEFVDTIYQNNSLLEDLQKVTYLELRNCYALI